MAWKEVDNILADGKGRNALEEVLRRSKFDVESIKIWIYSRQKHIVKESVLSVVHDFKLSKLSNRVLTDECHLEDMTADDDLEARAYCLAFTTFRKEWFAEMDVGIFYPQ